MKKMLAALLGSLALALALASCGPTAETTGEKVKVGYIYVGPVGDYGWSHAHDVGRRFVEAKFPQVESVIVESVPEGDALRIIDRLVNEEGVKIVFTTSFGYMDDTAAAAAKYPEVTFFHCSGFKRAPNLGNYFAELYEMYYLNGLMAGALTKSNKIGYVGAFPISEVVRHINAFALGVKSVNPNATVDVRWIYSWYDPAKAREAAEAMVAEGVDSLAFTEDTPAVIEVAQEHTSRGKPVTAFSHYSPMLQFGTDAVISGQLVDWGVQYEQIFTDYFAGKTTDLSNYDLWWKAKENAAVLGADLSTPINPKFEAALKAVNVATPDLGTLNVYDLVMKRLEDMKASSWEPFTGPIRDQAGTERYAAGVAATQAELISINWFVDNVRGEIPAAQ